MQGEHTLHQRQSLVRALGVVLFWSKIHLTSLNGTLDYIHIITRKSSCMNSRGIPPTAYQVLHLLSYPGEVVPHPWMGRGAPSLAGGYPISELGVPIPGQGIPLSGPGQAPPSGPGWVTPHLDLDRVSPLSGPGSGTPHLNLVRITHLSQPDQGTSPPPAWDLAGRPPRCEQTETITFPILQMRAVKRYISIQMSVKFYRCNVQ